MKLFTKKNSNSMYDGKSSLNELANKFETDKGSADKSTLSWGKDWPARHIRPRCNQPGRNR